MLREDPMKRTYKIFAALLALLFLASSPSAQTTQYVDADKLECGVPGCRLGENILGNTPGIGGKIGVQDDGTLLGKTDTLNLVGAGVTCQHLRIE